MKTINISMEQRMLCVTFMTQGKAGTVEQMRKVDKVCNVLEEGLDVKETDMEKINTLKFEDTDFTFLKQSFDSFEGWLPQARKQIIAMAKVLEEAKE